MAKLDGTTKGLAGLAVLAWSAAVAMAFVGKRGPLAERTPAAAAPTVSAPAPTETVEPTAAPSAVESAAPPIDPAVCVAKSFPEGSLFEPIPDLSFVCSQKSPLRGAREVLALMVKSGAGKNATPGMKLWATLEWYNLAAFWSIRSNCCPNKIEPEWSIKLACPLTEALTHLGDAVRKHDDDARDGALAEFTAAATCVYGTGQGSFFGQGYPPSAGVNQYKEKVAPLLGPAAK